MYKFGISDAILFETLAVQEAATCFKRVYGLVFMKPDCKYSITIIM